MKKYLTILIITIIGYFFVESIYTQINKDKTPGKAKRLECQKRVTTFEKGFDLEAIKKAQNQLKAEDIKIYSHVEKAKYTTSVLFDFITLEQTDHLFYNILNRYKNGSQYEDEKYQFSYYIYENDKNDPGKKNKKSTLYVGYFVFEVKNEKNRTIYKIQSDIKDPKGADVIENIECIVESFMSFK